ncbi:hypothetical protein [Parabacteroides gordonii]|jgi:hypothetical protein|uniref:hypothetical protein n=1 Tax=Parabacteroides gordonii TaxID=574930 RepID=UPI000EEBCB02|nr:hypothetical protein [Parabacteroides gordonii]RGP09282.1 hypothetical protein DXB27_23705 [Parabacteroides gordonii]
MYYSIYKDMKGLIADEFGIELDPKTGIVKDASNSQLKDIQWFNNQYEGVIHTSPVVFIEFSELDISSLTKQTDSTDIVIRLHVVAEVMDESDGDVWDEDVCRHEKLAHKVLETVKDWRLEFNGHETRPLRPVSWTHYHKYNGWMVTLIGLKTKG